MTGLIASLGLAPRWAAAQNAREQLRAWAREAAPNRAEAPPAAVAAAPVVSPDPADPSRSCAEAPEVSQIARALGIGSPCSVRKAHLGNGLWNATEKWTFSDGRAEAAVVVKKYAGGMPNLKWRLAKALYPFRPILTGPEEMFRNETAMNASFRAAGLRTLDIVATFPERRLMVTRFLEGAESMHDYLVRALKGDDDALAQIERLGAAVAKVHAHGLRVGDLGTGNTMVRDGEIYFVDLDQASTVSPAGWDLAEFLYNSANLKYYSREMHAKRRWAAVARALLSGYARHGGDPAVIAQAADSAYARPYRIGFDPMAIAEARQTLEAAAAGSLAADSADR